MLSQGNAFSSGSYSDVRRLILGRLQSARIKDQVFEVFKSAYDQALQADQLVLSRVEKKRLLVDVMKIVLTEMNKRLDES